MMVFPLGRRGELHFDSLAPLFPSEAPAEPSAAGIEIECSDLPYLIRPTIGSLPSPDAHLCLPRTQHRGRVRHVGLVWAAGGWNPTRFIPLAELRPLIEVPGLTFWSLQQGPRAIQMDELPWAARRIQRAEPEGGTILDTVAALSRLDLLVTVDTMLAHLGGAMGLPTWVLLAYAADWRWMLDTSRSPWYPSLRLFRQPRPGDWSGAVRRVLRELGVYS